MASVRVDLFGFKEKWSETIAANGFTCVPNLLIRNFAYIGITPPELAVIVILESYRYTYDNLPRPSIETISQFMGCTERHTTRLLASLENKGLLDRNKRFRQTSEYDISPLIDRLDNVDLFVSKKGQIGQQNGDIEVYKGRP